MSYHSLTRGMTALQRENWWRRQAEDCYKNKKQHTDPTVPTHFMCEVYQGDSKRLSTRLADGKMYDDAGEWYHQGHYFR
jgi:hypothetical protein